ncbi:MFS transporter [Paludibaculum fermentans]|uniref:MFS transporter n=1 Tax=Paludibaculum fermentans TaxID=1473598 RepID=A0A7S7NMF5_PALFE|nr:MFS transporter [Paludibaculum fermentans]QOY86235.1 MFS transporter [Paludibaculum fermentans]
MNPRPSSIRWLILAILFIVTTNNYLDRIMLTILSPVILDDLHFSELEFGYVNSAFQFAYAVGFLIMGKVIDSKGTRWGYSVAIVFWSVAAGLHSLARSFVDLSFWRGLLGLGESGNFPAAIKAVSEWFPKKDRALATGIFNSGTNIASVCGPPVFVWMNFHYGWRACFLITASTGFICLILWWWIYRQPRQHKWVNEAELAIIESDPDEKIETQITWSQALRIRETYGFGLAKFFSDPVWWFYLTWLALYFKRARGLSLQEIGWAVPVIYFTASFGSVAGGWVSGFLIGRGWESGKARKATMALFALCMPLAATAVAVESTILAIALISLATAAHQGYSANLYTTVSDVFPKSAVASVIGIGGFMGGIGGVIFTALLPGYLVTHYGYTPVFVMMGTFHLIAWTCTQVFMGKIQKITVPV